MTTTEEPAFYHTTKNDFWS